MAHRIVQGEAGVRTLKERSTGGLVEPPSGWIFVPAGDAALTRRLKAAGDCWCVVHRRRNRWEQVGMWTDPTHVAVIRKALIGERGSITYQQKLAASRHRRMEIQTEYVKEFALAVRQFLNFHARYAALEAELANAITQHATPVGSQTVARTQQIPLERRAEAAVIAWLRHQTTAYDELNIPRVAGERRLVRKKLAAGSRRLLEAYREGVEIDPETCPLRCGLARYRKLQAAMPVNISKEPVQKLELGF